VRHFVCGLLSVCLRVSHAQFCSVTSESLGGKKKGKGLADVKVPDTVRKCCVRVCLRAFVRNFCARKNSTRDALQVTEEDKEFKDSPRQSKCGCCVSCSNFRAFPPPHPQIIF